MKLKSEELVTCIRQVRNTYKFLIGNSKGKRLSGRLRRRWEILLRWIFKEIEPMLTEVLRLSVEYIGERTL
jgi:hypothetical protein